MLFAGLGSVRTVKNCDLPAINWLTSGFVCTTLSLNWLSWRLQNQTSERASNSDTRQRKIYYRTDLFRTTLCQLHLVHQLSSPKLLFRCEISCKVQLKLSTKTVSVSRCESFEIGLFYVN